LADSWPTPKVIFPKPLAILERQGAVMATRDWGSMKAPVLIVTATLALAILLAGWLLIATTSGEEAPAGKLSQAEPSPSSLRTQRRSLD
jgi:hypothetical protein